LREEELKPKPGNSQQPEPLLGDSSTPVDPE
jgi:hypothetical protein